MDSPASLGRDPFLAGLRHLPNGHLLSPCIAEALLHLPPQTFDVRLARQEEVPQLTSVEGSQGYTAADLLRYVEEEPGRCGPTRIQHVSFPDFLTNGRPDNVWTFGMVLLDFHGRRRPIDLLLCAELTADQLRGACYQTMTLAEYVTIMDGYLSQFEDQKAAEKLAAKRARLALNQASQGNGVTPKIDRNVRSMSRSRRRS